MKKQRVKFPWDLYWENKTDKLNRYIVVNYLGSINLEHLF